jgi:hypothetical protein
LIWAFKFESICYSTFLALISGTNFCQTGKTRQG